MKCPRCGAAKEQIDNYDSKGKIILICLICGHEWTEKGEENGQPK